VATSSTLASGWALWIPQSQSRAIKSHTIVEAHPDVLKRMEEGGWMQKENVRVVQGRWQDVLPQLGTYDGKC